MLITLGNVWPHLFLERKEWVLYHWVAAGLEEGQLWIQNLFPGTRVNHTLFRGLRLLFMSLERRWAPASYLDESCRSKISVFLLPSAPPPHDDWYSRELKKIYLTILSVCSSLIFFSFFSTGFYSFIDSSCAFFKYFSHMFSFHHFFAHSYYTVFNVSFNESRSLGGSLFRRYPFWATKPLRFSKRSDFETIDVMRRLGHVAFQRTSVAFSHLPLL